MLMTPVYRQQVIRIFAKYNPRFTDRSSKFRESPQAHRATDNTDKYTYRGVAAGAEKLPLSTFSRFSSSEAWRRL
jgi:hypothetical protein